MKKKWKKELKTDSAVETVGRGGDISETSCGRERRGTSCVVDATMDNEGQREVNGMGGVNLGKVVQITRGGYCSFIAPLAVCCVSAEGRRGGFQEKEDHEAV